MDASKDATNKQKYRNAIYVGESTARNLSAVPSREREQYNERTKRASVQPVRKQDEEIRKKNQDLPRKSPRRSSGIDFISMAFLTASIMVTLFVCMNYLKMQASILELERENISSQKQLIALTDKNDAMLDSLTEAIDLDYVYQVAVGELGMVFPNQSQVIKYEGNDQGVVIQYKDIPELKQTIIDKILH